MSLPKKFFNSIGRLRDDYGTYVIYFERADNIRDNRGYTAKTRKELIDGITLKRLDFERQPTRWNELHSVLLINVDYIDGSTAGRTIPSLTNSIEA